MIYRARAVTAASSVVYTSEDVPHISLEEFCSGRSVLRGMRLFFFFFFLVDLSRDRQHAVIDTPPRARSLC